MTPPPLPRAELCAGCPSCVRLGAHDVVLRMTTQTCRRCGHVQCVDPVLPGPPPRPNPPEAHVLELHDRETSHVLLRCSCGEWRRVVSQQELRPFDSFEEVIAHWAPEHGAHVRKALRPDPLRVDIDPGFYG